jgi:solute carrier family 39 (zinc transporter), member 1/2/3
MASPAAVGAPSPVPNSPGCSASLGEDYNQALAIASIFIIFVVSFVGFMIPVALSSRPHPYFRFAVVASSCAGTGVLFSVGFIHILGDAVDYLTSPCLPASFVGAFPDWATLFCTLTVTCMLLVDYLAQGFLEKQVARGSPVTQGHGEDETANAVTPTSSAEDGVGPQAAAAGFGRGGSAAFAPGARWPKNGGTAGTAAAPEETFCHDGPPISKLPLPVRRGSIIFTELSVCSHSIPVGLALGVQGGSEFVTLLIAVIFHQLLEGMGVGAAALQGEYSMRALLSLAILFAVTAPLGIAVGVGLHSKLNTESPVYALTLGAINSIAAGMLIYIAFTHMNVLATKGRWLRSRSSLAQAICLGALVAGAALMMVIGRFV